MRARILTAIVLIPAVVALVWWAPALLLAALAAVVAMVALTEFFDLAALLGMRAFRKWTGMRPGDYRPVRADLTRRAESD